MVLAERVVALRRHDEVTWNQVRPLVNHLIEGMLAVGPRFPPHHRTGFNRNGSSVHGDRFAVAFHVALLQMGGKPVQRLAVW